MVTKITCMSFPSIKPCSFIISTCQPSFIHNQHRQQRANIMVNPGFLLHIITETPASIAFLLTPSMTLAHPQPHAHPVIQQYALLLTASVYIAYTFLQGPTNDISRKVAAALSFYHLGPLYRVVCRIRNGEGKAGGMKSVPRNPWLHLTAHVLCFMGLLWESGKMV